MPAKQARQTLAAMEQALRNLGGTNMFTQQVEDFTTLSVPDWDERQRLALEKIRKDGRQILDEDALPQRQDVVKVKFILGRTAFLLGMLKEARLWLHEAWEDGLPAPMAAYHLAMTYAADVSMQRKERFNFTKKWLQMVVNEAGPDSRPGMEARLHIRLLDITD